MPKRWSNYETDLDIFWLLFGGTLVFTMQIGYAMLEFGSIHSNNKNSVVVKNIFSLSITAICWWVVGWSLAFGSDSNGILGVSEVWKIIAFYFLVLLDDNVGVSKIFFC